MTKYTYSVKRSQLPEHQAPGYQIEGVMFSGRAEFDSRPLCLDFIGKLCCLPGVYEIELTDVQAKRTSKHEILVKSKEKIDA